MVNIVTFPPTKATSFPIDEILLGEELVVPENDTIILLAKILLTYGIVLQVEGQRAQGLTFAPAWQLDVIESRTTHIVRVELRKPLDASRKTVVLIMDRQLSVAPYVMSE